MLELFDAGLLPIENSKFLESLPPEVGGQLRLSKLEGMLIGGAIGDVLGNKLEGSVSKATLAPIGAFHPRAHITDDTQLTFLKLETLMEKGWLDPETLATKLVRERIIGIGSTVKKFVKKFKDLKYPWFLAAVESAGNGALMSLSPVIVPHLPKPSNILWADAVVTTRLIYYDRLAISSSVSFTNLLWKCFSTNSPPEPEWWLEEYIKIARELEGDQSYYETRFGEKYRGPGWYYVEKVLTRALEKGMSILELNKFVGSGAYLLETIPITLYIMIQESKNPLLALSYAVGYTKDADTIGAIVGYLVGALHGIKAFPEHLVVPVIKEKLPKNYLNLVKRCEKMLVESRRVNADGCVLI